MNALDPMRHDGAGAAPDQPFCTVNGRACAEPARPGMALVDWLRQEQQVHTVHRGCDTGHCGSCAVMLDGRGVKSCAVLAGEVQGRCVTTADALAAQGCGVAGMLAGEMRKPGVFQCGYCASAFVIAATELLERDTAPTEEGVRQAFDGLLCRCTGYQRIVDAVLDAAARLRERDLVLAPAFIQPASLEDAASACARFPLARLMAGGQQIARDEQRSAADMSWISLRKVAELRRIEWREGRRLAIGAACTHDEIANAPLVLAHIPALADLAGSLGDALMRNRGTLGGALFDIVPGSSYPGALLALDATVATTHRDIGIQAWCEAPGSRVDLAPGEIVREVRLRVPDEALHRALRPVPARVGLVSMFAAWLDGELRLGVCGQSRNAYLAHEAGLWLAGGSRAPRWDRSSFSDARADARYRNAIALELLRRLRRDIDNTTLQSI